MESLIVLSEFSVEFDRNFVEFDITSNVSDACVLD